MSGWCGHGNPSPFRPSSRDTALMLRSVHAHGLPALLLAACCGVLGSACSSEPEYHLKSAAQWTVCPSAHGYSKAEWSSAEDSAKWLDYMWSHNCTFSFIGWDAETMIWLNEHPDSLDD